MAKEQSITVSGKVVECLPNAMFKILLDQPKHVIIGTISGKIRMFNINILLGDRVDVEVTPYDLSRGRIIYRHK